MHNIYFSVPVHSIAHRLSLTGRNAGAQEVMLRERETLIKALAGLARRGNDSLPPTRVPFFSFRSTLAHVQSLPSPRRCLSFHQDFGGASTPYV